MLDFRLPLVTLLLGCVVSPANASSHVRQRRIEQEESSSSSDREGFAGRLIHGITNFLWNGYPLPAPLSEEQGFEDTGAEVFLITFSPEEAALAQRENVQVLNNLNVTKITQENGINGDPMNRYVWSMALDNNEDLYVGTLNQNYKSENLTSLGWSIMRAPFFQKFDALVDTLLRQWSGIPVFESAGGQIYHKSQNSPDFDLQLQASPDHLGFRKMINYNGYIYAGSANGPDGPYSGEPYDFDEVYANGVGAKIFSNAGGSFEILDDQGHLDGFDKSIRSLVVSSYSNRLFVGTETYECAKIVAYDANAGNTKSAWKTMNFQDVDCSLSVSQLYDLGDGKILFGAWKTLGYGLYMLDETNNDEITELRTPRYPQHLSCGVMEIRVFKGHLYVGILSFIRGFALVRAPISSTDDVLNLRRWDWELVSGNGFQREQRDQLGDGETGVGNDYTWSSAEVNGVYFLGTFAGSRREEQATGQLWASVDGMEWKLLQNDVLAASRYMYGFRTMEVTKDQTKLYIGSAVNMYIPDQ